MEVLVNDVQVRKPLKECALEVCVHVAGDCLHIGYPLSEHKVTEFMHDLLLLGMSELQHMAHLKVYDYGGISVPVVQLERICAQIPCLPLRLPESGLAVLALLRIERREPRAVDRLHHIPVEPYHEGHCLKGLTQGKQVTHECEQQQRDALAWGPEGHLFREGAPALPACSSWSQDLYPRPSHPQRGVPKRNGSLPVFLHRLSAARAAWCIRHCRPARNREDLHRLPASFGRRAELLGAHALSGLSRLHEALEMGGDPEEDRVFSGMGNGGQLGCRRCYTCQRAPSLFGVYML